ncbi:MAG: hypothetical protein CM1200mP2_15660 [Planctomycetaceae bacterium]|nr:MAG: hypothetical protein CM1200mP2_15660 [Planctomycetaceae bacterium]
MWRGRVGRQETSLRVIHRSDDSGKTWKTISVVRRRGKNIDEPAIAQLKDGRLIMATRPDGGVLYPTPGSRGSIGTHRQGVGPTFRAPQLLVLRDGTVVAWAPGMSTRSARVCLTLCVDQP